MLQLRSLRMAKESNPFDLTQHDMLHDNVLVKALSPAQKVEDDLYDPEQYEDKSEWGEVISVGPGRILESGQTLKPSVKKGDIILYGKYSTYKTRIAGEDYLIIRDDDVMSKHGK